MEAAKKRNVVILGAVFDGDVAYAYAGTSS